MEQAQVRCALHDGGAQGGVGAAGCGEPGTSEAEPPARSGGTAEQQLVAQALPVLRSVARSLWRRSGGRHDLDELSSLGGEALVPLVRAYDPRRSPLGPFLQRRLTWAIRDGLRRDTHSRTRAYRDANLAAADARAEAAARASGVAKTARSAARRQAPEGDAQSGGGAILLGGDMASAPATGDDPEQATVRERERARVRHAVAALPRRERELVEAHYFAGGRFDRVAAELGISKSWASRLHARALQQLSHQLAGDDRGRDRAWPRPACSA